MPQATGRDLPEWFRTLDEGPGLLRFDERVNWLRDEHNLSHGHATAIVHEHDKRREAPAATSRRALRPPAPYTYEGSAHERAEPSDPGLTVNARAFLHEHHNAVLATFRRDGRPQMSPVGATVDEKGRVIVSTRAPAMKTRNLRRDPRVSVIVLNRGFYSDWVQVEGSRRDRPRRPRRIALTPVETTSGWLASTKTGTTTGPRWFRSSVVDDVSRSQTSPAPRLCDHEPAMI